MTFDCAIVEVTRPRADDDWIAGVVHALSGERARVHVSLDGRRLVAVLPALEPTRLAALRARLGAGASTWRAQASRDAASLGPRAHTERVVVERRLAPADDAGTGEPGQLRAECLEVCGARLLESHLSLDRRRLLCIFDAVDAESLRRVTSEMGLAVERVWTARRTPTGVSG